MDAEDFLITQRNLRRRLLDDRHAGGSGRTRDLTAHMLLHLDDPLACWRIGTRWLQQETGADRITGGLCDLSRPFYAPGYEALRPDSGLASIVGTKVRTSNPVMIEAFKANHAVMFENVSEYYHLTSGDRTYAVLSPPMPVKMAMSLRDDNRAFGLVCAHWLHPQSRVSPELSRRLAEVVNDVIAPILAAATRLAAGSRIADGEISQLEEASDRGAGVLDVLTPAELRLAKLAVTGMTYKEIARQLNRSFSTVDHHLRNIREKLGVKTAPKLLMVLSTELGRMRH